MILFLHPHLTYPGGGTKFVLATARGLAETGLEVGVLSIAGNPALTAECQGVKFFYLGGPLTGTTAYWFRHLSTLRRVSRVISEIRPSGIFSQSFPSDHGALFYRARHYDSRWF